MMERFRIMWKGPYLVDRVWNLGLAEEFGVYMITRRWGQSEEKILYIGMTYWQDFPTRLVQHMDNWLDEELGNNKIRLGTIKLQRGRRFSEQKIKHIEALLIYLYKPRYNTQNIKNYPGRYLMLINEGRRGPIKRIITTDDIEDWL